MRIVSALISGLIFGLGLLISGMANPAKVMNFLDIFGTWDPSLAFVMGGAIAVAAPGFIFVLKRPYPLFSERFQVPTRRDLDPKLLTGAALFGAGWGMGGLCPGPAITSLGLGGTDIFVFCAAMLVGMSGAKLLKSRGQVAA